MTQELHKIGATVIALRNALAGHIAVMYKWEEDPWTDDHGAGRHALRHG